MPFSDLGRHQAPRSCMKENIHTDKTKINKSSEKQQQKALLFIYFLSLPPTQDRIPLCPTDGLTLYSCPTLHSAWD